MATPEQGNTTIPQEVQVKGIAGNGLVRMVYGVWLFYIDADVPIARNLATHLNERFNATRQLERKLEAAESRAAEAEGERDDARAVAKDAIELIDAMVKGARFVGDFSTEISLSSLVAHLRQRLSPTNESDAQPERWVCKFYPNEPCPLHNVHCSAPDCKVPASSLNESDAQQGGQDVEVKG